VRLAIVLVLPAVRVTTEALSPELDAVRTSGFEWGSGEPFGEAKNREVAKLQRVASDFALYLRSVCMSKTTLNAATAPVLKVH
jgi:hypothetical protein